MIAKVLRAYWYVVANEHIAALTNFTFDDIYMILGNLIIQLVYAFLLYSVMVVIQKKQLRSGS
jgi:hypothetical protein